MSETPSYELQGALIAALSSSVAMKALVGDPARIFDAVPADPTFPYVEWGDDQELPDEADCVEGSEVYATLHVWARTTETHAARPLAKMILGAIRTVLYAAFEAGTLTLSSHRLVEFSLGTPGQQIMRDPDGLTAHGIITFRALTEPV